MVNKHFLGSLFLLCWKVTLKPKKEPNNFQFLFTKWPDKAWNWKNLWPIKWQISSVMSSDRASFRPLSDHFFVPQLKKKSYLKQPLQNVILQRNGKQCIKNKCLSGYINAYKNWTFTFKKGLSNYPSGAGAGLPIQGPRFKSAGWLQDQGYFSISSLQS